MNHVGIDGKCWENQKPAAGEISVPSPRQSTMTKLVESGYARVGDLKVNLSFFLIKLLELLLVDCQLLR